MSEIYDREALAANVAESRGWADLMRRLGVKASGGRRRVLQEKVAAYGIDTSHFKQRSPWRKYPDEAIAKAVASSTTLREVAQKLGAAPATGTLSHIRRRIAAIGIDVSHFPGLNRPELDLPFTSEELRTSAASATSIRAVARDLAFPTTAGLVQRSDACSTSWALTPHISAGIVWHAGGPHKGSSRQLHELR
ncbi:hypothetical protein AB0F13_10760 [Streptomyces sp. NPDC026206]|uniref:hypothetical protein n=1 Tax=Streptomyces sp. NPDC026206 TaxID=3157089 RepID=UPI0033CEA6D8